MILPVRAAMSARLVIEPSPGGEHGTWLQNGPRPRNALETTRATRAKRRTARWLPRSRPNCAGRLGPPAGGSWEEDHTGDQHVPLLLGAQRRLRLGGAVLAVAGLAVAFEVLEIVGRGQPLARPQALRSDWTGLTIRVERVHLARCLPDRYVCRSSPVLDARGEGRPLVPLRHNLEQRLGTPDIELE